MAGFDAAIGNVTNFYTDAYNQLNQLDAKGDPQAFAAASLKLQMAFTAANTAFSTVSSIVSADGQTKREAARSQK
jgi:hypothetical protein